MTDASTGQPSFYMPRALILPQRTSAHPDLEQLLFFSVLSAKDCRVDVRFGREKRARADAHGIGMHPCPVYPTLHSR